MCRQKGVDDALSITERDTTLVVLPVNSSVRGIGPDEIIEETIIWHVYTISLYQTPKDSVPKLTRWSLDTPDIIHGLQARTEPTMDTEDLASNDRCNRESIEDVNKRLPRFNVCTPLALVVESIHWIGCQRGPAYVDQTRTHLS